MFTADVKQQSNNNNNRKIEDNKRVCRAQKLGYYFPRSRSQSCQMSHRKVKQNDKLRHVQDSGSLAVFKVTARDQGHYKGPSGIFVTYCNISCSTMLQIY